MNIDQPFYIFSVERSELGLRENGDRTSFVGEMLRRDNIPFTVVKGKYAGTEERAFFVFDSDWVGHGPLRDWVQRITGLYEQESFLYVDANRSAALYTPAGGKIKDGMRWHEADPASVSCTDAITVTPDGRAWVAA